MIRQIIDHQDKKHRQGKLTTARACPRSRIRVHATTAWLRHSNISPSGT
jgi:hypothetical protein